MTKIILLDTNIYHLLKDDSETRDRLTSLISAGQVSVIATPKVIDELAAGPFGGLPDWFPITEVVESVAVLGHWRLGKAQISEGKVYTAHRGISNKIPDAIISDSGDAFADVVVSQDGRLRRRLARISDRCIPMSYSEFQAWLISLG